MDWVTYWLLWELPLIFQPSMRNRLDVGWEWESQLVYYSNLGNGSTAYCFISLEDWIQTIMGFSFETGGVYCKLGELASCSAESLSSIS